MTRELALMLLRAAEIDVDAGLIRLWTAPALDDDVLRELVPVLQEVLQATADGS